MTTDALASRLVTAGFSSGDAQSRARLAADAAAGLTAATRQPPRWGWFVPGRIEVFGKHTDYAGGRSLVAAVPRGFAIVAAPRSDGRVRVIDARWQDTMEVDPGDQSTRYRGWSNYAAVVVRRLAFNFPGADLGADLALASDLPRAAGVSSSSALVVGVATALIRRAALDQRADFRAVLETPLDLAGYMGAVENGLTFKSLASLHGVGTHGGSEDHTAILTCQSNRVSAFSYMPVRRIADETVPAAWRFVVMSSGVQADKAGSVRDRYNRASLLTRALLAIWNGAAAEPAPTLAAALASAPDAHTELCRRVVRAEAQEFTADDLMRRLSHFVAEDGRVLPAARAFGAGDATGIGALAGASQDDADRLLGNQIEETRALATAASRAGAIAASSFGAGFGGSVWALAPEAGVGEFVERWTATYRDTCPHIARVESFVTRPGPAVTELVLDD